MDVRPATPGDVEEIREVARTSWTEAYDAVLPDAAIERVMEDWYAPETLRREVDEDVFYVAEEDGIVGFAHAEVDGAEATIHRVYVHPAHWREGFGTELLDRVETELSGRDAVEITLEVLADNPVGLSFYRGHGYETVDRGEIEIAGEPVPRVLMRKEVG